MNETIGDYRLIEKLGEGAAGEVFLATPTKDKVFAKVGQLIALKRYKPDILRKAHQLDRIEKEFQVGSQLSHPNLVRIYEYPLLTRQTDAPYLVTEYVDGVTLDKWIEQYHPLPQRLLLQFAVQLLHGVAHLHESNILHRDLKPQNIMITSTFDVKIMDYGVVRIKHDTPITPDDMFLGTIRNSSPEMLFGEEYNERADLYSLGTVIYALLHGEQVFADETQFARLVSLVKDEHPQFDIGIKNQGEVSAALFEITHRLLEKSPNKRYESAKQVLNELEPVRAATVNKEPLEPLHGYIATALTGLESDARDAISFTSSKIAQLSKAYNLYVYEPRKTTDPLLHQDVNPSVVYRLDRMRVLAADVLFVIANRPSFGVGQEIEIATGCSTPTILLVREGSTVSRMVTGSPANIIDEIHYRTPEELEHKLRKSLARNLDKVRKWRAYVRTKVTTHIGQKLADLRRQQGYESASDLADSLGISTRLLEAFEQGDYQNVSLHLINTVAVTLGSSLNEMLGPVGPRTASITPRSDTSIRRLENTARKLGWSTATYLELRDDYERQLAASGESLNINQDQWVARHSALEKRRLKEADEGTTRQQPLFGQNKD